MRKLVLFFFIVVLGTVCKKSEQTIVQQQPPEDTSHHSGDTSHRNDSVSIPIVKAILPFTVSDSSADFTGWIKDNGGLPILSRGICWSISPHPTLSDSVVYSMVFSDTFTCAITGLTPGTKYYIRVFAKNDLGVGYDEFSIETPLPTVSNPFNIYAVGWRNMDAACNELDPGLPACLEHLPFSIKLEGDSAGPPTRYNCSARAIFDTGYTGGLSGIGNVRNQTIYGRLDQEEYSLNGSQHGTFLGLHVGNNVYEGTYNRYIRVRRVNGPEDSIILSESGHFSVVIQP